MDAPKRKPDFWKDIFRRRKKIDIDLQLLDRPIIDLAGIDKEEVVISGKYSGDRIRIRNAKGKTLFFQGVYIDSSHKEDAIIFEVGQGEGFILEGDNRSTIKGAITFWGVAKDVTIKGLTFDGGWVGIRATQPQPHTRVDINNCTFRNIGLEAIYIGPSYPHMNKCANIAIKDNKFFNIGWDAIQVGNTLSYVIQGNHIDKAGVAKEYGQDYGITINPGSLGYVIENLIINTPKQIQVLDSRAFFHKEYVHKE
jgi:hypothetical protein